MSDEISDEHFEAGVATMMAEAERDEGEIFMTQRLGYDPETHRCEVRKNKLQSGPGGYAKLGTGVAVLKGDVLVAYFTERQLRKKGAIP